MKTIESAGKTIELAISEGLRELRETIDNVDVVVISNGGFLRKAKVKLTVRTNDDDLLQDIRNIAKGIPEVSKPKIEQPKSIPPQVQKTEQQKPASAQRPSQPQAPRQQDTQRQSQPQAPRQQDTQRQSQPQAPRQQDTQRQSQPNRQPQAQPQAPKSQVSNAAPRAPRPPREFKTYERILSEDKAYSTFIVELLNIMKVDAEVKVYSVGNDIDIDIVTEDSSIIGYRGEVLDSLQYLTSLAINKGDNKFKRINVDCSNYRNKREESLVSMALKMADKAVRTGKRVILEPMSSANRRIIHAALSENENIITKSEGNEPNRHLVIFPKKK